MESEDIKYEDAPQSIVFEKTTSDFKRGFFFAMRCIIDMVSNKSETYTGAELLDFLHNFLLVNRALANIENMKNQEKKDAS